MKRLLLFFCAIGVLMPTLLAQNPKPQSKDNTWMIEYIPNMTRQQRKQIMNLLLETRESIEQKRSRLNILNDSIRAYLQMYEDQTDVIVQLFERKARLQLEFDKEMYANRVRLNALMSQEQYEEFNKALKNCQRKNPAGKRKEK